VSGALGATRLGSALVSGAGIGLLSGLTGIAVLPRAVPLWAVAAVAGGLLGSGLGSRHLKSHVLRRLLAAVLVVAGAKLILT